MFGEAEHRAVNFLHADDMADACVFLMKEYSEAGFINIGVGEDLSIKELAEMIKEITRLIKAKLFLMHQSLMVRREN